MSEADTLDCLVVGGGPAGLTGAIYLGRFRRSVIVVDKDEGRLSLIPRSHNHPGYPDGVVGRDLLEAMRAQARRYGATVLHGEVTAIRRDGEDFVAETDHGPIRARTVMLATGVVNLRPPLADDIHADAVARGLLRYCPICDGFEQTGKRIAVLGADEHGVAEALFLRTYSEELTLLALTRAEMSDEVRASLDTARIALELVPVSAFDFSEDVTLTLEDGRVLRFDTLYSALGSSTRNDLGRMLGTDLQEGECFITDEHRMTSVPGVYAAGDAIEGLDQISVAMGSAARAAVAIHNDLRDADGRTLERMVEQEA